MSNFRTVIIGLDGVPYRLLHDLANKGIMENTKTLIENGIFRQMRSSIPEVSSVAWSSIITGKNPAEHGIFGFTDIPKGTYRLSFPNFSDLKTEPFWQRDFKGNSIIANVPSTFPVRSMNGIHISGFVSLDLERSVFPKSLIPELQERNYKIDVDSSKAHQSLDLFLTDLERTLEGRINSYRFLWDYLDWEMFMLVFTGTDRLSHFLWHAYEDEENKYHSSFLNHFKAIDEVVGEIANNISNDDLLILLSDHGFELVETDVNINHLLKEEGFLKLKEDAKVSYSSIEEDSKAFCLDPARIYINLDGKYPRGSVKISERDSIVEDLIALFKSLEKNGKKVIDKIHPKEEIFKGPFLDQAPDLALIGNKGFNLKAGLKAERLFEKHIFTGKHTQHDAFFLTNTKFSDKIIPDTPSVSDVWGIIMDCQNEILGGRS